MLGPFEFARPLWLAGLAALVPVVLFALASSTGQPLWQRAVTLVTRSLLVIAIVLALAGISTKVPIASRWLAILTDASASVGKENANLSGPYQKAVEQAGVEVSDITFAGGMHVLDNRPARPGETVAMLGVPDPDATAIASAVQRGASLAPTGKDAAILLLSDGRETTGDLRRAIRGLHLPVHVVPLGLRIPRRGTGIVAAEYRDGAIAVSVFARDPASGGVELRRVDNSVIARQEIKLTSGVNQVSLPIAAKEQSEILTVALTGFPEGGHPAETRRVVVPSARGIPVLIVSANGPAMQPLVDSLRAAGARPEVVVPGALLPSVPKLNDYALVILANVKPRELSADQYKALDAYVRERGGGLLIAGDERTFAAAEYQGSPLEALAPLAAQRKVEERERSLALVLVFDKSNSMANGNRIGFAKDAAKRAVQLLGASDKFGVISFGTEVEWVADVQRCDDASKARVTAQIDKLQAGGLTNMYPALERAYLALEQTPADRRHLVLLTDGVLDSKPGDFLGLAREMSRSGVTVSTLSVNAEAEHPLLQDIARLAKGRYFRVIKPEEIVGIIERETQRGREESKEGVKAQVYRRLPKLEIGDAPALANYAPTSPKPAVELLLMAGRRDPLLAWQRVGEGVVTALAASPNDAAWNNWSGRGAFWARLFKHTARPVTQASKLEVRRERDRVIVTVDAIDARGEFVDYAKATAKITDLGGEGKAPREIKLEQIAPGRYEGSYDVPEKFADLVEVAVSGTRPLTPGPSPPGGEGSEFHYAAASGITRDYPDEFIPGPPNLELLREVAAITGGKFDPKPEDLFGASDRVTTKRQEWWHVLLIAAIVLFAADLGLKRIA